MTDSPSPPSSPHLDPAGARAATAGLPRLPRAARSTARFRARDARGLELTHHALVEL
jgi:hypothetical protein